MENIEKIFFLKTTELNEPILCILEWSLIKFVFFMMIWNPRWPPPQVIVLTQDHMGKYRNIFFSEAIALVEPKLCINHWKVLYKLCVFYVDRNSKMTTTARHSFYIGPIGSFYNQVNDTGSWEPLVYNFHLVSWLGLKVNGILLSFIILLY